MACTYLFKLILIGDTAVGKSCLLLQFADKRFKQQHDITIGVEYGHKTLQYGDEKIKLQIWDTAGSETFKSITHTFYKGVAGALLVFDITRRETYKHVTTWLEEIREHANANITLFLVGNKSDMEERRQVTQEEALKLAQENGMEYVEVSAKVGTGVDDSFLSIVSEIHKKIEEGIINPKNEASGVRYGTLIVPDSFNGGEGYTKLKGGKKETDAKGCC